MLHKSSDTVSFVEHLVYKSFKLYNILILVCLFAITYQKCMFKTNVFLKFQVLHEKRKISSDVASFVKYPVYSTFQMYSVLILDFLVSFATVYPKCILKSHFFLESQVLRQRNSDISPFVEHIVYSYFKMYSALVLKFFLILYFLF